jgi:hypothetical protein
VTHAEALEESARLGREHPERARFSWFAQESAPGAWRVVRVALAPHAPAAGTPTVQPPPEPPQEAPEQPPRWLSP